MGIAMKPKETILVWVTISEPWDTEIPDCQLKAELQVFADDGYLIELEAPFDFKKNKIEWLVAKPRHAGKNLSNIKGGELISVNMTAVKDEVTDSANPLDLSWWRGGNAFIGEVKIR